MPEYDCRVRRTPESLARLQAPQDVTARAARRGGPWYGTRCVVVRSIRTVRVHDGTCHLSSDTCTSLMRLATPTGYAGNREGRQT